MLGDSSRRRNSCGSYWRLSPVQQLRRFSYLTSLRASVSLQVDQRSAWIWWGLRFGESDEMEKYEKEYLYSSKWNIVFYMKSLFRSHQNCVYTFVCFTNWIFYHANYLTKKFITWSVWHPNLSLLLHKFAFKIRCSVSSGVSKVLCVSGRFTPWVLIKVKNVPPLY